MAIDLQDVSRRLFQTAKQLWINTYLRPDHYALPVFEVMRVLAV